MEDKAYGINILLQPTNNKLPSLLKNITYQLLPILTF
jgi:hypothetical protein